MASFWRDERPAMTSNVTVEQCMRLLAGLSPRLRVRCLYGLQSALQDARARHDQAEVATLHECVRRLHALLGERG